MTIEDAFKINFTDRVSRAGYRSVRVFAKEHGMNIQQTYRYASGDHLPSLITAWKIAGALGCTVDDLLKGATE